MRSLTDTKKEMQDLVDNRYYQVSLKKRLVARLPRGKTGLEALGDCDPDMAARMRARVESEAADFYLRCCAETKSLSEAEFAAFKEAGGGTYR